MEKMIVYKNKCRICLKYRINLRSIYDTNRNTTYMDMINSLSSVKIIRNDGFPDHLCVRCRKKLIESYKFKISIERSDVILHQNECLKRIQFNNISDVKIKIELPDIDIKYKTPIEFTEQFKDGEKSIEYNDTTIKKISNYDDKENKPLSVLDFLKSIKTETENDDFAYEVEIEEYGPNINNNEKYNQVNPQKHKKKKEIKCENFKKCKVPIKPVFLRDVKVVRCDPNKPKSKNKYVKDVRRKDICPYCGKITNSLKTHILIHVGERKFKCEICSSGFFNEAALKHHKKKHSNVQNFKCDQCVATFIYKTSLESHMKRHRDEKNYICNICSKAFKRKSTLARHIMMHNFANKSINCDMCSMSFYTKSSLRNHLRVHTGERPYRCEICSQPYSYKHDFNRHCLKKHGVFLKRRSVYVMNEEVLIQEHALMKDLLLRTQGIVKNDQPLYPFNGPNGALALELAVKALEAGKIPINYQIR